MYSLRNSSIDSTVVRRFSGFRKPTKKGLPGHWNKLCCCSLLKHRTCCFECARLALCTCVFKDCEPISDIMRRFYSAIGVASCRRMSTHRRGGGHKDPFQYCTDVVKRGDYDGYLYSLLQGSKRRYLFQCSTCRLRKGGRHFGACTAKVQPLASSWPNPTSGV